jgi:hypothetical protein
MVISEGAAPLGCVAVGSPLGCAAEPSLPDVHELEEVGSIVTTTTDGEDVGQMVRTSGVCDVPVPALLDPEAGAAESVSVVQSPAEDGTEEIGTSVVYVKTVESWP